jgi:catechol 2,3-dioxygenase-like lactoylglutathione lyase family enzyme
MYKGIDHVAIAARDSRALIEWYCAHLGMHVVSQNEKDPPTALVAGTEGSMFEIMPANEEPVMEHGLFDPGLRHVALRVDDFDTEYARLQELGVEFVGNVAAAMGGGKMVSFKDPEGNVLQIAQRPADFPR